MENRSETKAMDPEKRDPVERLSAKGRKTLDAFLRAHIEAPDRFNVCISPEDEMFLFELAQTDPPDVDQAVLRYFDSARLMLSEYRPIVEGIFGRFGEVDSVLEFACGHGRFTRALLQEVEPARLTVADIYEDAVAFQASQFGVRGLTSVRDPADYPDKDRYQLILVSSLFSHLPVDTFKQWLAKLYTLLDEDGVLVFSVHDEAILPAPLELEANGMLFIPQSESRSLEPAQYGTTFVSERFMQRVIQEACPGSGAFVRIPKGLWRYQDLYVVSRNGNRDLSRAESGRGPRGYLDRCALEPSGSHYRLGGWAYDFEREGLPVQVDIYAGDKRVQTCLAGGQRADVADHFGRPAMRQCGWTCLIDAQAVEASDLISAELRGEDGTSFVVACDTLERLLAHLGGT